MSTVGEAQDTLTTILQTAFGDTAHVQFGLPLEVPRKNERAYVLEDESDYVLGGGQQWREESYSLQVAVEVYRQGRTSLEAVTRRRAMVAEIDAALLDADFYGYMTEAGALRVDPVTVAWDKGYLAKALVEVPVLARGQ